MTSELPVAVIGAGPVGLAAAAHLVKREMPFVVLEAGEDVGANVRSWRHVRFFSPWKYSVDAAAVRLLEGNGWVAPDENAHPTGDEIVEQYLRPLASVRTIASNLRLGHRVVAVGRLGIDKVKHGERDGRPLAVTAAGPHGPQRILARAVLDATGTWHLPNPLGADGFDAIGEERFRDRIVYGIPDILGRDRGRYSGRRIAVVGSGHSAQNAVRDAAQLRSAEPDTTVAWILRRPSPGQMFGGGRDDQLPERGRLGSDAQRLVDTGAVHFVPGFRIDALLAADGGGIVLRSVDGDLTGPFDEIITATGARPDLSFLRELRLDLDPAIESTRELAPMIDPNFHSCGSVPPHGEAQLRHPEPNVYLVGAKSYGRAPSFLLATGYEQVRSVVAALAGDLEAAARVELVLPETGVCSSSADAEDDAAACCGTAPTVDNGQVAAGDATPAPVLVPAAEEQGSSCCGSAEPEPAVSSGASSCCGPAPAPVPAVATAGASACCG